MRLAGTAGYRDGIGKVIVPNFLKYYYRNFGIAKFITTILSKIFVYEIWYTEISIEYNMIIIITNFVGFNQCKQWTRYLEKSENLSN